MEKKYYYTPEVKFHLLSTTAMIADSNSEEVGHGGEGTENDLSKGFGSFYFDEDEE